MLLGKSKALDEFYKICFKVGNRMSSTLVDINIDIIYKISINKKILFTLK